MFIGGNITKFSSDFDEFWLDNSESVEKIWKNCFLQVKFYQVSVFWWNIFPRTLIETNIREASLNEVVRYTTVGVCRSIILSNGGQKKCYYYTSTRTVLVSLPDTWGPSRSPLSIIFCRSPSNIISRFFWFEKNIWCNVRLCRLSQEDPLNRVLRYCPLVCKS